MDRVTCRPHSEVSCAPLFLVSLPVRLITVSEKQFCLNYFNGQLTTRRCCASALRLHSGRWLSLPLRRRILRSRVISGLSVGPTGGRPMSLMALRPHTYTRARARPVAGLMIVLALGMGMGLLPSSAAQDNSGGYRTVVCLLVSLHRCVGVGVSHWLVPPP